MRDVCLTLTISASRSSGFKRSAEKHGSHARLLRTALFEFYLILTIQGYLAVFVQ